MRLSIRYLKRELFKMDWVSPAYLFVGEEMAASHSLILDQGITNPIKGTENIMKDMCILFLKKKGGKNG